MSRCPPCLWKNGAVRCSSRCTLVVSGPGHLGSQDANGDLESTSCILPRIDPRYAHELASSVCFTIFLWLTPWLSSLVKAQQEEKVWFDLIWFDYNIPSFVVLGLWSCPWWNSWSFKKLPRTCKNWAIAKAMPLLKSIKNGTWCLEEVQRTRKVGTIYHFTCANLVVFTAHGCSEEKVVVFLIVEQKLQLLFNTASKKAINNQNNQTIPTAQALPTVLSPFHQHRPPPIQESNPHPNPPV